MPRTKRKTIDLPSELVDKLMLIFKENKDELYLIGITSFSGFMSRLLNGLIQEGVVPKDLEKYFLQ